MRQYDGGGGGGGISMLLDRGRVCKIYERLQDGGDGIAMIYSTEWRYIYKTT